VFQVDWILLATVGVAVGVASAIGACAVSAVLGWERAQALRWIVAAGLPLLGTLWVRRVARDRPDPWRWRYFALAAYVPLVLGASVLLAVRWNWDWRHRAPFTPAAWLTAGTKRVFLVDDLLRQDRLVGRTLAEAEALLGPADRGPAWAGEGSWDLGPARSPLSFADEILVVRLGPDGRILDARVVVRSW
jgi:hypothetical protein